MKIIKRLFLLLFSVVSFHLSAHNYVYISTYDSLLLLDISTCNTRTIGKTIVAFKDIAISPQTGRLYGIDGYGDLYSINRTTAVATFILNTCHSINSLTFSKKGILYAMGNDNIIHSINTSTGVCTELGRTNIPVNPSGDISLLNGKLYLSSRAFNSDTKLIEIDIDNSNSSTVFNSRIVGSFSGIYNVFGLASIGCEPELYAFSMGNIYKVPNQDPTLSTIQCYNISSNSQILGAASVVEDVDFSELDLSDSITLCKGDTVDISAAICNGNYMWQDGSTSSVYTVFEAGTYQVTASIYDCNYDDSIKVGLLDYPILDLGKDTTLCEGAFLNLDVHQANSNYLWQDGSIEPNYLAYQPGMYTVSASIDNCISKDSIYIDYTSPPSFSWEDYPRVICEGTTLVLDASNVHPTASYSWQDNSTEPTFSLDQTGIYTVSVTNICGTETKVIEIETKECNCLEGIPDVFTPNNDGTNDSFSPITRCELDVVTFEIYNRWGQVVYQTNDANLPWDGKFKGVDAAIEVYIYLLEYYDDYGFVVAKKGEVTLLR